MRKAFVVPTLREEANLSALTLGSGGGGFPPSEICLVSCPPLLDGVID